MIRDYFIGAAIVALFGGATWALVLLNNARQRASALRDSDVRQRTFQDEEAAWQKRLEAEYRHIVGMCDSSDDPHSALLIFIRQRSNVDRSRIEGIAQKAGRADIVRALQAVEREINPNGLEMLPA